MSQLQPDKNKCNPSFAFATRAIHAGQESDKETGATTTPIYQTSTYEQTELGVNKGYIYARTHNPTRTALEICVASLENGLYGLAFSSGLAACSCVAQLLRPGDHVLLEEDVYGGVYRLFEKVVSRNNIEITYINTNDIAAVKKAIQSNTKLIWLESPTNPLLKLSDIAALSKLAKEHNLLTVVDNTFATPYFQKPLALGADIVVHSTTKYLNGHSDMVGGGIVTSRQDLYEQLQFNQNALGGVPGPFDCFLVLRGIKTLALRMKQHEHNAQKIAEFLSTHPAIKSLRYPGLASHPQHELAKQQQSGFGGMISCELENLEAVKKLLKETKLFALAESLGGAKSLICHPSTMTHLSVPKPIQLGRGITEGLVRLSVGLEDADDLIKDLECALLGS